MQVNIDKQSGFCFGVINAIKKAEEELAQKEHLYCLGHIVHNNAEVERLKNTGLVTITHEQFKELHNCTVLIRAHGEPPETYQIAETNNIKLIDATCPVVLKLQSRIKKSFNEGGKQSQIVIFGKEGHAEVNGLVGQTGGQAIVVKNQDDLIKISKEKNTVVFSQTTMDIDNFKQLGENIEEHLNKHCNLKINDTICRQVANRAPHLRKFAAAHNVIVFVSGIESSNGKVLFNVCKEINPLSYFVSSKNEIKPEWFINAETTGICGATSTPRWQMEEVANYITALQ